MNTTLILESEQSQKTERKVVMDVRDITKSLPLGRVPDGQESVRPLKTSHTDRPAIQVIDK